MGTYKQPCIHCGALVERDARRCPLCGSLSPFVLACPACLREVNRADAVCGGCGRALHIACPTCGQTTFVQERCERCGASLMVTCQNKRCGQTQFFQNTVCTACGHKIKK